MRHLPSNPWLETPRRAPFILPADRRLVREFNEKADDRHQIIEELLPLPFIGSPEAPVVLLNLNPGFNPSEDFEQQNRRAFHEASRLCYTHAECEMPFFFLDPRVGGGFAGQRWWERVFAPLAEDFEPGMLAQAFCCVEYFPYHSQAFRSLGEVLESQRYSFALVEKGIDRGATIILMRSRKLWFSAVPRLEGYNRYFEYRNPRCRSLSPRNCPLGYPQVVRELQRVKKGGR